MRIQASLASYRSAGLDLDWDWYVIRVVSPYSHSMLYLT